MGFAFDRVLQPAAAVDNGREIIHSRPIHFKTINLSSLEYSVNRIRDWLWKNTNGRFYVIRDSKVIYRNGKADITIGLESNLELIQFGLIQDQFKLAFDDFDI